MSFEHLDDPNPPTLDTTRWERAVTRSRAIRRRRFQRGTAASVVVLAVAVAGAVSVWSESGSRAVRVQAPVSSTTSGTTTGIDSSTTATAETTTTGQPVIEPATTTTTTIPQEPLVRVTVSLEVTGSVFTAGQDVTGTIVFDNHGSSPVALLDGGCAAKWAVAIGPGRARPDVPFRDDCAIPSKATFAPGVTRVPFRAATTYLSCAGSSTVPFTKCLPNGQVPPLPAGPAQVWFVTGGTIAHLEIPAPIPITIVAAPSAP